MRKQNGPQAAQLRQLAAALESVAAGMIQLASDLDGTGGHGAAGHGAKRLDAGAAAAYLGMEKQTLANWRATGTGPAFVRVGGRIEDFAKDLDGWLEARKMAAAS